MSLEKKAEVGQAIAALAEMLRFEFATFGERLKSPQIVAERWVLLGELQEFRSKCEQCLEAVVATILNAFTSESLEDVLPRYTDATMRAVKVRSALVDLGCDLDLMNENVRTADKSTNADIIHQALEKRLEQFAESASYRQLKASDKHAIIKYRIHLKSWEMDGSNFERLRLKLEDLTKYLELTISTNERDDLIKHDKHYLKAAQSVLRFSSEPKQALIYLKMVYGRGRELDEKIRALDRGEPITSEEILELVNRTQALLDQAASPAW